MVSILKLIRLITVFLTSVLLSLAMAVPSANAARKISYDLEVGLLNDSNVNRAESYADIQSDSYASLIGNISYNLNINDISNILFSVGLEYNKYSDLDKLDHFSASIRSTYLLKPVAGFTRPVYSLTAQYRISDYDSILRSADTISLEAVMRKRLDDRISFYVGAELSQSEADSIVFDNDTTRLFFNVDYALDSHTVYISYDHLDGDIVSTAIPTTQIITASKNIVADDVYPTGFFAYRIDAKTQLITLGYNYGLSRHQSIDVFYRFYDSDAYGGISYDGNQVGMSYLHRFN